MAKKTYFIEIDYYANPDRNGAEIRSVLDDHIRNAHGRVIHKGRRILFSDVGDAVAVRMDLDGNIAASGCAAI